MKLSLSLIAVIISANLFAQTTRRVNDEENIREIYYVLKSNKSIKEGPYLKKQMYGRTICEGFYKSNLKDSLWKYYNGNVNIQATGYYKEDKKVGLWNVYNSGGDLAVQYDYTNNKLLFFKSFEPDVKWNVINGTDTLKTFLDRVPINLNVQDDFTHILISNLRYPEAAIRANARGKVVIAFTLDTLGKPINYTVKEGIGHGCDEEAMRVVKLLGTEWLPGILKGKPVAVELVYPITFNFASE